MRMQLSLIEQFSFNVGGKHSQFEGFSDANKYLSSDEPAHLLHF